MTDKPRLQRSGHLPEIGLVHLGPGAFFRAFNAVYTHEAMHIAGGNWGIAAVSLRNPTARDQLAPQDGMFTSISICEQRIETQQIGSIAKILVAPEDPNAVISLMADPAVKVVSLTITEKGYCHEPATGRLDKDHPDIVNDLAVPTKQRSAIGLIVAALQKRRQDGLKPFTVLSCDNLPSNGALARGVILDFANLIDAELAAWIRDQVPFPATMVDRITPATTDADIERLAEDQGYFDPGCVVHEQFRQWVIEDTFSDGRPAWDLAGAQFVKSVDAHETMKLRCLNGTHSTLAYLGYLSGYETVADTVADPVFSQMCVKLWRDEILPTVPAPEGEDLDEYCAALLQRYMERSIRHRTWQIAMDGSQKLPQRLLGTIKDNLAKGQTPKGLCLAVAAWMRYVGGVDEAGAPIDVRDPMASTLRSTIDESRSPEECVVALLSKREIFDESLAQNEVFRNEITTAYSELLTDGAKACVAKYASL